MNVAMIAARVCGRSVPGNSTPSRADCAETVGFKPPWRRAPRTKAAVAIKTLAIQKVLDILDRSNVAHTEPLPGKFVIQNRLGVVGSKLVTFWPTRNRLR